MHLADMMKILMMWKFGGYYSDTERIFVRNVTNLGRNFVAFQRQTRVVYDFSHFQRNSVFLLKQMEAVSRTYKVRTLLLDGSEQHFINVHVCVCV